jgi:hypothetical protein
MKELFRLLSLSTFMACVGCGHIPVAEAPVEMRRVFNASFDKTWESVLAAVQASGGTLITNDKPSGVIAYRAREKVYNTPVYVSVCVKSDPAAQRTAVLVVPRMRYGAYVTENERGLEKQFFNRVQQMIGG